MEAGATGSLKRERSFSVDLVSAGRVSRRLEEGKGMRARRRC